MAASTVFLIFLLFSSSLHLVSSSSSSSSTSVCPLPSQLFLHNLQSECPLSAPPPFSIEVDGESLDGALRSSQKTVYTAVLFHASWCPFSQEVRSTFDVLSSMFPQITHLAVEQSVAMPSLLSRYGIHSMPSLLLVKQTNVRYHGPKDLYSLVRFYRKVTGVEPIDYLIEISEKPLQNTFNGSSRREILAREPWLVFSILFLGLKAFLYFLPGLLSRLKAFWALYIPHLNLEIFGEASQSLGRLLQMIDVKRVWTKVRLCTTKNFQKRAKNARVWASSLASVSLGESSSPRPSSPGDS